MSALRPAPARAGWRPVRVIGESGPRDLEARGDRGGRSALAAGGDVGYRGSMAVQQDSLIDRYVAAVLERVPPARSATAESQVRGALAAAVADQQALGLSLHDAQRAAVASLGDPIRYASQHGGRAAHLIGEDSFPFYWRLLRLVLSIAVPISAVVVLLAEAAAGSDPVEVVVSAAAMAFNVGVQICFWVTLVFALLERSGNRPSMPAWSPDQLPQVRQRSVSLADTVFTVCLLSVLIAILLWQRSAGVATGSDGSEVPFINPSLWRFWMPALIAVLAASILLEVAKFRTGRWTVPLAVVNTVLNAAFIGIVLAVASRGELVNPAIALPAGAGIGLDVLSWVLVLIAVSDTVDGWWRSRSR